jgi:two-component system, NtrC family, nitrogen regulation response regulator NtrX
MSIDILVVDDERDIRELVSGILEDEGYAPRMAAHSDAVFDALKKRLPALVILDIWLQGSKLDGLEILDAIKELHPQLPVLIISGHGNIETAVAAIRKGAYDFIEKPFNVDKLVLAVHRALETAQLRRENTDLKTQSITMGLIGHSSSMVQLRSLVEKIADSKSRILISGPAGAGKEMLARTIHGQSHRSSRPFVIVRAATIAPDKMEEALFGIEGIDGQPRKVGLMEQAHGGSLLFDEVADMPMETQSKILRVLVEQRFIRVGGTEPVEVDVRIISTTSKNLLEEAEADRFRKDLFHRLSVVPISAPTLASRREDIPELAEAFITSIAASGGIRQRGITSDALAALQAYHWPGNVRQLRNVLERTLLMMGDEPQEVDIVVEKLPNDIVSNGPAVPSGESLKQLIAMPIREAREKFEREYLIAQINRFSGNISRTASFIGMERSALHRKLKALGIESNARAETSPSV